MGEVCSNHGRGLKREGTLGKSWRRLWNTIKIDVKETK
jgi:hypothetical protein